MADQERRDRRSDLYQRLNSQLTEIQRARFEVIRTARLATSELGDASDCIQVRSEFDQRLSYVAGVNRAYGFDLRSAFLFPRLLAPEWCLERVWHLKLADTYYIRTRFEDQSFRKRTAFENKFITTSLEYALIYGGLSLRMLDIQARLKEIDFS